MSWQAFFGTIFIVLTAPIWITLLLLIILACAIELFVTRMFKRLNTKLK